MTGLIKREKSYMDTLTRTIIAAEPPPGSDLKTSEYRCPDCGHFVLEFMPPVYLCMICYRRRLMSRTSSPQPLEIEDIRDYTAEENGI
jgi:DNA-directed RNA polymerase subunit RPC12/RpoP